MSWSIKFNPNLSPVAQGSEIVTLSITSTVGGSNLPWSFGQPFAKGDVPSGSYVIASDSSVRYTPVSLWDDGSVKTAVFAGLSTLSANVARSLSLSVGANPGGTALAESNLIAAAPTATIVHSTYGTISLAALLNTAAFVQIEHASSVFAQFTYAAQFPSASNLWGVFYVRLWSTGQYEVCARVQNGGDASSGTSRTGTFTITIAGTQVHNASRTVVAGEGFNVFGWSGTNPAITPTHSTSYLLDSGVVNKLGAYGVPNSAALTALNTTYTPMGRGSWTADMGDVGYQEQIAVVAPHWDAAYCVTGDVRAWNSVIANARSYDSYAISFRDTFTKRISLPSSYPTSGNSNEDMSGAFRWEANHHPNACYMAYVLTGHRLYLELMQANAWACYFTADPSTHGSGTSRKVASQTRGRAWEFRTYAAVAAVAPTGDSWKTDAKLLCVTNLNNWKTTHVDSNSPATGFIGIYDDKEVDTGFQHSMFESLFLSAAIGFAWDVEIGLGTTDKATHLAVRDFAYRVPIGALGRGQAFGEYSYRQGPGPYRTTIGATGSLVSLYSTWGEIQQATYNDGLASTDRRAITESYADDPSDDAFPQGNWGHLATAISYAVDHAVDGADEAYLRMTTASNWATNAAKFSKWPAYGASPRSAPSVTLPTWYSSQSANQFKNIGATWRTGLGNYAGTGGVEVNDVAIFSYSGGALNTVGAYVGATFYDGPWLCLHGGGHAAYNGNEIAGFGPLMSNSPTWQYLSPANPVQDQWKSGDQPVSAHTYSYLTYIESQNRLFIPCVASRYLDSNQFGYTFAFDFDVASPASNMSTAWLDDPDVPDMTFSGAGPMYGSVSCYDSGADRVIFTLGWGQTFVSVYDVAANTWTRYPSSGSKNTVISYSDRKCAAIDPVSKIMMIVSSDSVPVVLDCRNMNNEFFTPANTGAPQGNGGITWDPINNRFVYYAGGNTLYFCNLPANPYSGGNTYVWTNTTYGGDTAPAMPSYSGNGMYNRFQYVPDPIRGYIACAGYDRQVTFFKLS